LVENENMGREDWQKTSEYRHMGEEGLKLLKNRHMIFECSLTINQGKSGLVLRFEFGTNLEKVSGRIRAQNTELINNSHVFQFNQ